MKLSKKFLGLAMLGVGAAAMAAGVVTMLTKLPSGTGLRDAEYLVEIGAWERVDAPEVVWEFTEVGKGRLTTNDGQNEYDFLWAIDGGRLLVETDWLYTLNDEYEYRLDQEAEELTLDGAMVFRPVVRE